jgi:hypothetical protein
VPSTGGRRRPHRERRSSTANDLARGPMPAPIWSVPLAISLKRSIGRGCRWPLNSAKNASSLILGDYAITTIWEENAPKSLTFRTAPKIRARRVPPLPMRHRLHRSSDPILIQRHPPACMAAQPFRPLPTNALPSGGGRYSHARNHKLIWTRSTICKKCSEGAPLQDRSRTEHWRTPEHLRIYRFM